MKSIRGFIYLASLCLGMGIAAPASASLNVFQQFVGNVAVSTDGWGSTSQSGVISAQVPTGATVLAAYLYTSTYHFTDVPGFTPGGTLGGSAVDYSANLGTNDTTNTNFGLTAFRADVTAIIKPVIDGGAGGIYNFDITETRSEQDGSALVVVYSLASLPTSTVGILDGFSASSGDSFSVGYSEPIDTTAPGYFAEMRLGIGFSAGGNQTSTVSVNGTTITEVAGGYDDGAPANGALITVGGFDDPFSALLPSGSEDHERYNIAPYIASGSTTVTAFTVNPSQDDNIFLAVLHTSGEGLISTPTPEPGTLALLGLGLAGLGLSWRRKSH